MCDIILEDEANQNGSFYTGALPMTYASSMETMS